MTKNKTALVVLIAAAAACVSVQSAGAQSLAEVARQEAARRQAVKSPVRVITNDNLKVVAPALPAVAPGAQPEPPAGAAPAEPAPGKPPAAPDPTQDPEYWRTRITDARQARDRNAFLIEAVRTRLNSVVADSFSKDDPNKRAQLRIERQQTQDELERMTKDQAELEKKIADIEEEARRANIPPGWLR